jgi:hypothetical protein
MSLVALESVKQDSLLTHLSIIYKSVSLPVMQLVSDDRIKTVIKVETNILLCFS